MTFRTETRLSRLMRRRRSPRGLTASWLSRPNRAGNRRMSYYGYRHLAPALGRWTNRDPVAEMYLLSYSTSAHKHRRDLDAKLATAALYSLVFISNGSVSRFDPVGLWTFVGCSTTEVSRLERAISLECATLETDTFRKCCKSKEANDVLPFLRGRCQAETATITCMHPGDAEFDQICDQGTIARGGGDGRGAGLIWVCPQYYRHEYPCTLLHEAMHTIQMEHGNTMEELCECCRRSFGELEDRRRRVLE